LPLQSATFNSLNTSSVAPSTRVIFYKQSIDGVAWLHEQGIMHRDIKPANLVVGQYDPPSMMIIDFGCATTEREVLYDWPGTVPYLAPEQRKGLKHDRSVDIWSLALVGMELFDRPRPQRQLTIEDYDDAHRWLAESDPAKVPIAGICSRMLRWHSVERPEASDALRDPSIAGYAHTQRELRKSLPSELTSRKRGPSLRSLTPNGLNKKRDDAKW
jgi:serine/threonine protein kinase